MNKVFYTDCSREDGHPSDDELLLCIDGELATKESTSVRSHLESCWSCRVRSEKIQEAISFFVDYRNHVLTSVIQPPPRGWRSFDQDLSCLAANSGKRSLLSHMLRPLERIFSLAHFSIMSRPALRAVACVLVGIIIVALAIRFNQVPSVSAGELLQNVTQVQATKLRVTTQPVVYQKLQLRRTDQAASRDNSVSWEIWNDMTNSRLRQSIVDKDGRRFLPLATSRGLAETGRRRSLDSDIVRELEQVLHANHLDLRQPLSAVSYQSWRNSLGQKHEKVSKSRLANGRQSWTLRTSVVGAAQVGQVAEALLIVRADDWHPVEQRLHVKAEEGERVYELTETDFQVISLTALDPAIFSEPQIALLPIPSVLPKATSSPLPSVKFHPSPTVIAPVRVAATAELEVEVLQLLSQAGADLGEQVSVMRSANNQLYVQGIVATDKRKEEIIRALDAVRNNSAVKVEVSTVAEAVEKERQRQQPSRLVIERRVEVEKDAIPAYAELRRHLATKESEVDEHVRRFANQMLVQTSQAQQHAWALKRLSERFSPDELHRLAPEARAKWLSMLREHARALSQYSSLLRRELQSVFPSAASSGAPNYVLAITDDVQLRRAVEQLFDSHSAVSAAVRASFTVSTQASTTLPVKAPEFWRSLNSVENLTAAIQIAR